MVQVLFLILRTLCSALSTNALLSDVARSTGSLCQDKTAASTLYRSVDETAASTLLPQCRRDCCLYALPQCRPENHHRRTVRSNSHFPDSILASALNPHNPLCITRWRSCVIHNEERAYSLPEMD